MSDRLRKIGKADTASQIFLALAILVSVAGIILFMSYDPARRDVNRLSNPDQVQQSWPPPPAGQGNPPRR